MPNLPVTSAGMTKTVVDASNKQADCYAMSTELSPEKQHREKKKK